MKKLLFVLPALAAGLAATEVEAQTTRPASAAITIPTVLYLEVTNPTITFPTPGAAEFDAGGVAATTTSVISARGNVDYHVQVLADAATMTSVDGAVKSAGDLLWSTDGTTFTPLATTAATVASDTRGRNDVLATVEYEMALSYDSDVPDQYSLGVTYTIIAQ